MQERPLGRMEAERGEGGNSRQKAVPPHSGPPAKAPSRLASSREVELQGAPGGRALTVTSLHPCPPHHLPFSVGPRYCSSFVKRGIG